VLRPDDTLKTERLEVRRYAPGDLELLLRLHRDERVMRWAGGVQSRAASEQTFAERILAYYDERPGLGCWATFERATGDCVGMHLLNNIRGTELIQVGYLLYPEYWGRGYATEMAVRILRYGFEELQLPQLVAITDLPNLDSQKVLLKAGLRRSGERLFAHYGDAPLAYFERDAADWLAERRDN
jgi:ribosomal-protein-alanine N-acetyltransferase